jgi:hypothetical protein
LIGTVFAFGGNPEKDALYLNVTPNKNDGATLHRLPVKDVPVDAFWPIGVYNAESTFRRTRSTPIHSTASRRRRTTTA